VRDITIIRRVFYARAVYSKYDNIIIYNNITPNNGALTSNVFSVTFIAEDFDFYAPTEIIYTRMDSNLFFMEKKKNEKIDRRATVIKRFIMKSKIASII